MEIPWTNNISLSFKIHSQHDEIVVYYLNLFQNNLEF